VYDKEWQKKVNP